jgi:hypothetical protein
VAPVKLSSWTPEDIAREVTEEAIDALGRLAPALGVVVGTPEAGHPPIYRAALTVARYALAGTYQSAYPAAYERLAHWLGDSAVLQAAPETAIATAVAVCEAREALRSRAALTSVQVGVLTGLDRDTVNAHALQGEVPDAFRSDETKHRPWRFKPTKALRVWMADKPGAVGGLC